MWEQIKVLEDHSDLLTIGINIQMLICDIIALKVDLAARRHFQKIEGTQEG